VSSLTVDGVSEVACTVCVTVTVGSGVELWETLGSALGSDVGGELDGGDDDEGDGVTNQGPIPIGKDPAEKVHITPPET
jgi:hypothetical protein